MTFAPDRHRAAFAVETFAPKLAPSDDNDNNNNDSSTPPRALNEFRAICKENREHGKENQTTFL
jgi:hypothetical protein